MNFEFILSVNKNDVSLKEKATINTHSQVLDWFVVSRRNGREAEKAWAS